MAVINTLRLARENQQQISGRKTRSNPTSPFGMLHPENVLGGLENYF